MANAIVLNGKKYGGDVDSVNTKTGAVVLSASDINDGSQSIHDALAAKVPTSAIVQTTGSSTTSIMSQQAVTELVAGAGFSVVVVAILPETGQNGVLYLVGTEAPYEEYVWVESEEAFEDIGAVTIDLSEYLKSVVREEDTNSESLITHRIDEFSVAQYLFDDTEMSRETHLDLSDDFGISIRDYKNNASKEFRLNNTTLAFDSDADDGDTTTQLEVNESYFNYKGEENGREISARFGYYDGPPKVNITADFGDDGFTFEVDASGVEHNGNLLVTEDALTEGLDTKISKSTGITAIEAVSVLPGSPNPTTLYLVG
jgi:hypothetical protein